MSALKKLSGHLAGIKNKIPGFRKTTVEGDSAEKLSENAILNVSKPQNRFFGVFGRKIASEETAQPSVKKILQNTVDKAIKELEDANAAIKKKIDDFNKLNPQNINISNIDNLNVNKNIGDIQDIELPKELPDGFDTAGLTKLINNRNTKKAKLSNANEALKDVNKDSAAKIFQKVSEKTSNQADHITKSRKVGDAGKWSNKTRAAAIVGTTASVAGIHAGVTGKSFKEANKDVIDIFREGASPIAETAGVTAGVIGAGAIAVGAEGATSLVKVGVDSSGPLLEELGKGASSIGGALGLGLPSFGFGDMDSILFIVVIIAAYYFYQKSSATTSSNLDSVIYN